MDHPVSTLLATILRARPSPVRGEFHIPSLSRSVRAVAVYDHHPPHCFGVGFRDGEPALAHHTERDDASALASAECVAVDGGGPVRCFAKRLIIHVRVLR